MRKLVGLLVVLAVLAGVLSLVDLVVREGVQESMASRIEKQSPGSQATVKISSFPFLGHLAVSGTVPSIEAHVDNVRTGDLRFTHVDMHIVDLEVDHGQLSHGRVVPRSLKSGTVVADLAGDSVDALAHVQITLGRGTVGVLGQHVPVHFTVSKGSVDVVIGHGIPDFTVPVPELAVLPCVGSVVVVPDALQLSCHFTTLPGVLRGAKFGS